jgi:hypothetical protein
MGFLDKLFGGGKKQQAAVAEIAVDCPHSVLVARWDSVADMGKEDKATRFMCETCHEMFSPEEAKELRDTMAARVTAQMQEIEAASAAASGGTGETTEDTKN